MTVTGFAALVVFTIWPEKDTEVADRVTGGPPASVLVPTNPTRRIAEKHRTDCLRKVVLEVRRAQKE